MTAPVNAMLKSGVLKPQIQSVQIPWAARHRVPWQIEAARNLPAPHITDCNEGNHYDNKYQKKTRGH